MDSPSTTTRSEEFEKVESLDLKELWRFPPQAHPVRHPDNGLDYFYLGEVFPTVRVRAQLEAGPRPQTLRGLDLPGTG